MVTLFVTVTKRPEAKAFRAGCSAGLDKAHLTTGPLCDTETRCTTAIFVPSALLCLRQRGAAVSR